MHKLIKFIFLLALLGYSTTGTGKQPAVEPLQALGEPHETRAQAVATYLGNEGILIEYDGSKVLFDPFFHNDYNIYQLVPEEVRSALFSGEPPYQDIDAIFVSHAHGDHFSAHDLVKYLQTFPGTLLIAPQQAIDTITASLDPGELADSLVPVNLAYRDPPIRASIGNISYDAVRIPHAGWPQRANISNLVFRVTLGGSITVVHMGDADPDDAHFSPLIDHWNAQATDTAFPPYWFLSSASGQFILSQRIAATTNIGLHVPVQVPPELQASGEKYFSTPGETYRFAPE